MFTRRFTREPLREPRAVARPAPRWLACPVGRALEESPSDRTEEQGGDRMNKVELVGDLVSPVEVRRDWSTGRTIGKAIIAVSRGVLGLEFVPVTLWDREARD